MPADGTPGVSNVALLYSNGAGLANCTMSGVKPVRCGHNGSDSHDGRRARTDDDTHPRCQGQGGLRRVARCSQHVVVRVDLVVLRGRQVGAREVGVDKLGAFEISPREVASVRSTPAKLVSWALHSMNSVCFIFKSMNEP